MTQARWTTINPKRSDVSGIIEAGDLITRSLKQVAGVADDIAKKDKEAFYENKAIEDKFKAETKAYNKEAEAKLKAKAEDEISYGLASAETPEDLQNFFNNLDNIKGSNLVKKSDVFNDFSKKHDTLNFNRILGEVQADTTSVYDPKTKTLDLSKYAEEGVKPDLLAKIRTTATPLVARETERRAFDTDEKIKAVASNFISRAESEKGYLAADLSLTEARRRSIEDDEINFNFGLKDNLSLYAEKLNSGKYINSDGTLNSTLFRQDTKGSDPRIIDATINQYKLHRDADNVEKNIRNNNAYNELVKNAVANKTMNTSEFKNEAFKLKAAPDVLDDINNYTQLLNTTDNLAEKLNNSNFDREMGEIDNLINTKISRSSEQIPVREIYNNGRTVFSNAKFYPKTIKALKKLGLDKNTFKQDFHDAFEKTAFFSWSWNDVQDSLLDKYEKIFDNIKLAEDKERGVKPGPEASDEEKLQQIIKNNPSNKYNSYIGK